MKLYLVRHGDYVINDSHHDVLSEKGISEINQLANFLMPLHIQVSTILHSGKMRAHQTADILSLSVVCDQPPQIERDLNPNDAITGFIDRLYEGKDLLVVGHLPFMSRLVGQLVVGNENREIVFFHTGTLVCLESLELTRWMIQWAWNPMLALL